MSPFRPEDEALRILAAVTEASDDAIIAMDLDGIVLSWNRGAERLYGYTAEEITRRSVALIFPDGQASELAANLGRVRAGQRVEQYETIRRTKEGTLVEVSLAVSPIKDVQGDAIGALAIARDVTARKRAERALRMSELRWRSIVDSAVDGVIVIDARGRIEAFNRGAERIFGYRESDVIGHNVAMLMPSPYREEHNGYLNRYLTTGEQRIIGIGREVTGRRRDGSTVPLHLSVGEMSMAGERKFTGILHDLSARVAMEQQLREQTSLARLGEMAAVIAHEVKNPLAGVRGAIQVIGSRLPADSRDAAMIKEIVSRIDSLNDLMQDLLTFARPPQPREGTVDLPALLTATADLLARDPALASLQVTVEGTAPPVKGDADLLRIVFLNLLMNSAHAMEGRGVIRIAITPRNGYHAVAVTDTGPGIPPEILDQIFMPFFTTKSRGSGLGLPTAKRLVEAHNGRIHVDSQLGAGTTMTVELPA